MSDARVAPLGARPTSSKIPWTQVLMHRVPLASVWTAIGIWAAILALCVAYFALFAGPEEGVGSAFFWGDVFSGAFVMALMIGYAPAATAYSQRAAGGVLRELRPVLRVSDAEFQELARCVAAFDVRLLRSAGIVFAAGFVAVIAFDPVFEQMRARASFSDPLFIWVVAINGAMGWMLGRLVVHELRVSFEFSRIGEQFAEVDLLNPRPLLPFARRGLQGALVWILCVSILSLHFAVGSAANIVPKGLVALLGVAAAALLLPVWGVHRRLAEKKRAELDRLCAQIGSAQAQLLESAADAPTDVATRLATLLTLKQHVEAAREWPFDVPTLARFALYIAIGLGSWLGGALVERMLDVALS
jgi:hypothetical protein